MIRVAHTSLQLETGGLERLLLDHAREIDRSAFELVFVSIGERGPVGAELVALGYRVIALRTLPGLRPSLLWNLARLFRGEAIDIVHAHNTKPLLYAGPAARLAGVRGVVHTRHGQRHGSSPLHHLMFRAASRCADAMVCVSKDAAARCLREGIHPEQVITIPNGVDTRRFAFAARPDRGPAVYVGRLSPEKGVDTLLRAAAAAARVVTGFQLHIAGDGPCRPELEALSAALGLTGVVRFLGAVSNVPAVLRSAGVFVLPSRSEGMPVTALEAMSSGVPVVATAVGGTPEVVDEHCGLLVPSRDHAALAGALAQVLQNPSLASSMGRAGRRRVEAAFSASAMVSRYEELYRSVLRGAPLESIPPSERRAAA